MKKRKDGLVAMSIVSEVEYVNKNSGEVIDLPLVVHSETQILDLCDRYGGQFEIYINGERIV